MAKYLKTNWIPEHKRFILSEGISQGLGELEWGQIITLIYEGEQRWVLVVDPKWEQKLHVLDLKYVPRKTILRVLNHAPDALTPRQFYNQFVNKPWVKELNAYRTYDRTKVSSFRELTYNLSLQPGEQDEHDIEEPQGSLGVSVTSTKEIILNERRT